MDTPAALPDPATLDVAFWASVAAILLCLILSAFFSGSETALAAASRSKLRSRADRGDEDAARALEVREDGERLIGAILLGNNVVKISAASLATALFTRLFGDSGVALATLVMTALVLVFAEVMPKTCAVTNPESAASRLAAPLRVVIAVLSPLVGLVRAVARAILRLFGVTTDPDSHVLSVREEIADALVLGKAEGLAEKAHRDRLLGALDLSERTVEEIMRHRSQIEMIDADIPPDAIVSAVLGSAHTRLPIYRGDQENIVGVIHAKDLFRAVDRLRHEAEAGPDPVRQLDVMQVAMPPYFIPDTTPLDEQMRQFLLRRTHFALVVDEYGALKGLITLEDILEEIVGEITDEFDIAAQAPMKPSETGDYTVDGGMTIRDLNRATDWNLPDDEANTVAGLVIHEAQMIPNEGQVFSFHGFRFEVLGRKENRITRLKIRRL